MTAINLHFSIFLKYHIFSIKRWGSNNLRSKKKGTPDRRLGFEETPGLQGGDLNKPLKYS